MFDLDGLGPKIRALYDTFLNWSQSDADDALALILANVDSPISDIAAGGKKRAVKLTSGSSWTHPANVKDSFVLVTLVAAGGAGARDSDSGDGGGGGGGGEVLFKIPYFLSGGSTSTSVPSAATGTAVNGAGSDGGNCVFGSLTARGGKGAAASNDGGNGGGCAGGGSDPGRGGDYITSADAGEDGAALGFVRWIGGGGGSGCDDAGGDGADGGAGFMGLGGAGVSNCGGGGGSWGNGGAAVATGGSGANGADGGGGGGCTTGTSGAGGAGFIIVEYEEAE